MGNKKWTDQQLTDAVKQSTSMEEVISLLGLKAASKELYVKTRKLDTSHWRRRKPAKHVKEIPLTEILIENSKYSSMWRLKPRLLQAGLLIKQCYNPKCNLTDAWLGKPITLQLDHINGINTDNRIENLRLLCPNCHSQTETYAGRNRRVVLTSYVEGPPANSEEHYQRYGKPCSHCEKRVDKRVTTCIDCRRRLRQFGKSKLFPEQVAEIIHLYQTTKTSYRKLAEQFGVARGSIQHILKGIKSPFISHW